MRSKEAFIDANLLVLLVVGQVDRSLVERHRRTRRFTPEDYDRLLGIIQTLNRVFVTPNTLTEASNLLKYDRMNLTRLLEKLRSIIEDSEVVPSLIVLTAEEWIYHQDYEAPFWQTVTRDGIPVL